VELRLLVTPDTILRWHRDIVRRCLAARSMSGKTGRPATRRNIKALVLRLARETPAEVPPDPRRASRPGAVFHSDRGSNYTSAEFAAVLEGLGIRQSVGRTGICFDNALAESFNAAVKVERVHRTVYPTRKKARDDIARYIENGP
jgi:transposase InsO family protein